jgi:hypothetical protein
MANNRTVHLLDELMRLAGEWAAVVFEIIHHHHRDRKITIDKHREYAASGVEFRSDGTNLDVERRLEIVIGAWKAGGFTNAKVWPLLAQAAVIEVPMKGGAFARGVVKT